MNTEHFTDFFTNFQTSSLGPYLDEIQQNLEQLLKQKRHGKWEEWTQGVQNYVPSTSQFQDLSTMSIGTKEEITNVEYQDLHQFLETLIPWRKGPFRFFDIEIETEWRSDWKWDRIKIISICQQNILDVVEVVITVGECLMRSEWFWESIRPKCIIYLLKKKCCKTSPVFLPIGIEHLQTHASF